MKKLIIIVSNLVGLSTLVMPAYADTVGDPCQNLGPGFKNLCNLGSNGSIGSTIGAVVNLMFILAAIIALLYLVIGGIKWVTSEGDSKNVEAARNQIIAAAVGLGVTFLSYFILNLLLTFLLGSGLSGLSIPQLK
jgi:hypothetical protein